MNLRTRHGQVLHRFLRDERAASVVEYAMIAAGIAAAIVGAVNALGVSVKGLYDAVDAALGS
jgi:pilus assembly protein Flp/PilA